MSLALCFTTNSFFLVKNLNKSIQFFLIVQIVSLSKEHRKGFGNEDFALPFECCSVTESFRDYDVELVSPQQKPKLCE